MRRSPRRTAGGQPGEYAGQRTGLVGTFRLSLRPCGAPLTYSGPARPTVSRMPVQPQVLDASTYGIGAGNKKHLIHHGGCVLVLENHAKRDHIYAWCGRELFWIDGAPSEAWRIEHKQPCEQCTRNRESASELL